jgi:hypothetical protein
VAEDSGRQLLGFSATIMPILSKSVGGDKPQYPVTKSTRFRQGGRTVTPSALAVFMLIASSNLVGYSTGRSDGLAPLRILST